MILVFYLMWFIRVFSYLVWFMVVMVIPPISSSKQAWPALGGSTEEQSKNLVNHKVSLRNGRFTDPQKEHSKNQTVNEAGL